jgi:5-methyltetrahydrofolate--homocysteine methyltransferase
MEQLNTIYQAVLEGDAVGTKAGVQAALQAGLSADQIMQEGLIAAMGEVGRLYEAGDFFVPEMLIAARAMSAGLEILKPMLASGGVKSAGRIVIGTVKGDLHDIGKNLVGMMLEGAGFEVIDLGSDVSPEKFVEAVRSHQPQLIGMSALLTTTMPSMGSTIKALQEAGIRDQVKVMIGGAPVTDSYARQIGADGFASDASSATRLARSLVEG